MSVATASAVLRSRLTRTISRALPRLTAAIAQAQPTLPVPIIPIFTPPPLRDRPAGVPSFAVRGAPANRSLLCHAGRLEQEPGPPLGLVDPVLDQAGAGHVLVLVANRVSLAQARRQLLVVVAQFGKHIQRRDEVGVVVQHALQAADVAHALGDVVGGRENLLALLVEEEMVIAEVRA